MIVEIRLPVAPAPPVEFSSPLDISPEVVGVVNDEVSPCDGPQSDLSVQKNIDTPVSHK